jgi:hypothetical protein
MQILLSFLRMEDRKRLYEALPGPVEPITVPVSSPTLGLHAANRHACICEGVFFNIWSKKDI